MWNLITPRPVRSLHSDKAADSFALDDSIVHGPCQSSFYDEIFAWRHYSGTQRWFFPNREALADVRPTPPSIDYEQAGRRELLFRVSPA